MIQTVFVLFCIINSALSAPGHPLNKLSSREQSEVTITNAAQRDQFKHVAMNAAQASHNALTGEDKDLTLKLLGGGMKLMSGDETCSQTICVYPKGDTGRVGDAGGIGPQGPAGEPGAEGPAGKDATSIGGLYSPNIAPLPSAPSLSISSPVFMYSVSGDVVIVTGKVRVHHTVACSTVITAGLELSIDLPVPIRDALMGENSLVGRAVWDNGTTAYMTIAYNADNLQSVTARIRGCPGSALIGYNWTFQFSYIK